MHEKSEIDKDRFFILDAGYPIDAIEVSDERSNKNFITYYCQVPTKDTDTFSRSLADIMPNPNYHAPEIFHREPKGWKGWKLWTTKFCKHYHIVHDNTVGKEEIKEFFKRVEESSKNLIAPALIQEIKTHYGVE